MEVISKAGDTQMTPIDTFSVLLNFRKLDYIFIRFAPIKKYLQGNRKMILHSENTTSTKEHGFGIFEGFIESHITYYEY